MNCIHMIKHSVYDYILMLNRPLRDPKVDICDCVKILNPDFNSKKKSYEDSVEVRVGVVVSDVIFLHAIFWYSIEGMYIFKSPPWLTNTRI